jgi:hypothetical protein
MNKTNSSLFLIAFAVCGTFAHSAGAQERLLRSFRKVQLTKEYFAEGAGVGDLNHDGKVDIVCGPNWFEGPEFKKQHQFYEGKAFPNDRGYSNNFFSFVGDFNGDSWDDVLVVGLPGTPASWYENPKGQGKWNKHFAFPAVDNEAPSFADIDGDGKPELLCTFQGQLGIASPNKASPTSRWDWRPISEKGPWRRFSHGLGVGDIDGDGLADFLMPEGWWRQPKAAEAKDKPWKQHKSAISRGGAQIYAVDVDGDGDADIVSSRSAHAWGLDWYEQTKTVGGPAFVKHSVMGKTAGENPFGVAFSQLHALVCADVNGDGRVDIVTGKCYWAHNGHDPGARDPAVLYWFRNTKTEDGVEFVPQRIDEDSGLGRQIQVVDVNEDGLPDVVTGNKKGTFVFLQQTKKVSQSEWNAAQPKRR